MDLSNKKRIADENGGINGALSPSKLTPADARKIIESFSKEQLLHNVQDAACRHSDVLDAVRANADHDPAQRKLFIRGLGGDTNTEGLRSLFSTYGELEEAIVFLDKNTGKSKGYGLITFRHIDGALLALKEPSKKIDGRMSVTQLAAVGTTGPTAAQPPAVDVSLRKIYVGGVPHDMPSERLLAHFSSYGEIEEGPLGFDKQTGKSRGFALFVYKMVDGARASLVDPTKVIDGHTMVCKLAADGKKGKPGQSADPAAAPPVGGAQNQPPFVAGVDATGNGMAMGAQPPLPGSFSSQFGGPAGLSSFGGFGVGGFQAQAGMVYNRNSTMPSSVGMGTSGLSSVGGQLSSSLGGSGANGYGAALGGPYSSQYGVPGSGGYGGMGVSSFYQLPPSSVGMPAGGYPESGLYGMSSSTYQQTGSSPGQRAPSGGGIYPSVPPTQF